MTSHRRIKIVIVAFACANFALALWGGKQVFSGLFDPIIRSFGA